MKRINATNDGGSVAVPPLDARRNWDPLTVLFVLLVFVLGLTKVHDTDAWTHLGFGRLIWEQRALPEVDPFVSSGPTTYLSWLFGLVYHVAYLAGGFAGVVLLKATVICGMFALLFVESLRPLRNTSVALIVFFAVVLVTRERFVERPEIFMMLFVALTVFALGAFLRDRNRRVLYALPVVHILWANSHTSIVLMAVPFFAFLLGGGAQRFVATRGWADKPTRLLGLDATPTIAQLHSVAVVFAICVAASLASPYGASQFTNSLGALASDWWTQEIAELRRPNWEGDKFVYVFSALVIVSFAANVRRLSLIDLAMAIPFLVLPFTAKRFVWFTAISAVFLVRNLAAILSDRARAGNIPYSRIARIGVAVVALQITALHLFHFKPFDFWKHQQLGLGVDYRLLPERALAYMDSRGITGTVYNLFEWGGYIAWRDFPRRTPFIDGRGYSDPDELEEFSAARFLPDRLEALLKRRSFEAVLVEYPRVSDELLRIVPYDIAFPHADWALVYWDDLSLVYVRQEGTFAAVAKADGYRHIVPSRGLTNVALDDPAVRSRLLDELGRSIRTGDSSLAHLWTGQVLNAADRPAEGLVEFGKAAARATLRDHRAQAYAGMGAAHAKQGNLEASIANYRTAIALAREPSWIFSDLASVYERQGNTGAAIDHYERAIALGNSDLSNHKALIRLYAIAGTGHDVEGLRRLVAEREVQDLARARVEAGRKAYLLGDKSLARSEYEEALRLNPSSSAAYTHLATVYYEAGDLFRAEQLHFRALELDHDAANSHYGLALINKQRGEVQKAIEHWETYLRYEPSGPSSRKAKQEIEALRQ